VAEARRIIDERASEKIISERTMLSAARRAVELAGAPKSQGGTEL
jgi:hypothetical protein